MVYVTEKQSNPAGTFMDKQETERFVRKLPRKTVLLSDEAYGDYVDSPDYESCLRYVKEGLPVASALAFNAPLRSTSST